ncbi:PTS system mannose/fructose/N-acetylgalactosamine-transporter subunit IIB [Aequitasia blattaphilus]|uniref:PTS sugar transporter subunit IIB n=1 Tax=Aequitasia blattaphilus TaxID=2949332 RepID=A0ABT1EBB6_9FIRM|nr:PTS sugar transporter subunit IIB [Aequitasia blattaphilus]MCP1103124.1 PTS sugar transporter subunit IIB [Aequitasia blattaphilus]MCR8615764.1 PTS sugar transporter subunit IIB [Aequitasia blattaphilus]
MAINLVRIDDRLIHGQVATTWVNVKNIEQILLISDKLKSDPVQQKIVMMTAPAGIKVLVFDVEKFISVYQTTEIKKRTMLILTNSTDVLRLLEGGVKFDHLNVGGMRLQGDRVQYTKALSATQEEKEAFLKIADMGVDIEVQMVPNDPPVKIEQIFTGGGK